MRFSTVIFLAACFGHVAAAGQAPSPTEPEALVMMIGDQHSAYERTAQLVALVDRLKTENPTLPIAILLNGDTLEYGNVVARRSRGVVDFALFAALAQRGPTVLNIGNHEPEFYDLAETIVRVQATGVSVISNIVDHATGKPYVPASIQVKLGPATATIVGITTDHLSTYRVAVRAALDLANPVVWANQNFPVLFGSASLPIVMSHAGLNADREILPLVPEGTLFAGAHDHQRFIHLLGRGAYVHSGSWNEYLSLAWLRRNPAGALVWTVEQKRIPDDGPVDHELAELIRETRLKYLTPADEVVVGRSKIVRAPADAARYVVQLLKDSIGVDAAFVGNTTFGAGFPVGDIRQLEFDACVRFDGTIYVAEVDGSRLLALLAKANQGIEAVFEQRQGEFLVASGFEQIDANKIYRIATTDWGARNTATYFGAPAILWRELPGAKFKARVLAGLAK